MFLKLCTNGMTRTVLLIGNRAIKIGYPLNKNNISVYSKWRKLLNGLISNLDEDRLYKKLSKENISVLCPVLRCYLCGFILVMPRAENLTEEEYFDFVKNRFDDNYPCADEYMEINRYGITDASINNYGILNKKIVRIDYGPVF